MFSGLYETKQGSQARADYFISMTHILGASLQIANFGPSNTHFHVETYVRHPKINIPM